MWELPSCTHLVFITGAVTTRTVWQANERAYKRELEALQQSSDASIEHFKKQLHIAQVSMDDLQVRGDETRNCCLWPFLPVT